MASTQLDHIECCVPKILLDYRVGNQIYEAWHNQSRVGHSCGESETGFNRVRVSIRQCT